MGAEKKIILAIDDQKEVREIIKEIMEDWEYRVLTAPGGREGIQLAKLKRPDIILLDLDMPRYSGIETCRVLKKTASTKDIPIIFLTSYSEKEDIQKAMSAGADEYIAKPFSPTELTKRIKSLTYKKRKDVIREGIVKKEELPENVFLEQYQRSVDGEETEQSQ